MQRFRFKWQMNRHTQQWEATAGRWQAIAARLSESGDWYPYVETIKAPRERHDGPRCQWAIDGRRWCEAEITRLVALARA